MYHGTPCNGFLRDGLQYSATNRFYEPTIDDLETVCVACICYTFCFGLQSTDGWTDGSNASSSYPYSYCTRTLLLKSVQDPPCLWYLYAIYGTAETEVLKSVYGPPCLCYRYAAYGTQQKRMYESRYRGARAVVPLCHLWYSRNGGMEVGTGGPVLCYIYAIYGTAVTNVWNSV